MLVYSPAHMILVERLFMIFLTLSLSTAWKDDRVWGILLWSGSDFRQVYLLTHPQFCIGFLSPSQFQLFFHWILSFFPFLSNSLIHFFLFWNLAMHSALNSVTKWKYWNKNIPSSFGEYLQFYIKFLSISANLIIKLHENILAYKSIPLPEKSPQKSQEIHTFPYCNFKFHTIHDFEKTESWIPYFSRYSIPSTNPKYKPELLSLPCSRQVPALGDVLPHSGAVRSSGWCLWLWIGAGCVPVYWCTIQLTPGLSSCWTLTYKA